MNIDGYISNQTHKQNKEEEIREIAYRIWREAGCPDGDRLVDLNGKMRPLKERHWEVAVTEWTYGPDYMRSW